MVLLAHTEEGPRLRAAQLLRAAGYDVVAVADGESARLLLETLEPRLLVADVGLREPAFYELCDFIRQCELATRVLIISSVHTESAYKRQPTSLYGADDCVEEHLLDTRLVCQVQALCED
jgi:DNA-binding response OmpR family regulator